MFTFYFFKDPSSWILPWILQVISYFVLLRKLNLKRWTALVPFLAEREFSKMTFRKLRSFYRPFVVSAILALGALYLGPGADMGRVFMWAASLIYGIFLIRLYWKLAKCMGKGVIFRFCTILCPVLFLFILGVGRSQYHPLPLRPLKQYSRRARHLHRAALVLVSAAEILVIVCGVGFLCVRENPPVPLVNSIIKDTYDSTKDITGTGDVISREDAMGKAAASVADMKPSRAKFFPDHSNDRSVVVLAYVVGSNLEGRAGLASVNIRQMIDASRQGENLTFVMEAGGSKRWFTKGIENASVGRYEIREGKVNKVKDLPPDTCMSEQKSLKEFISWAKKKYPADRYMLVLWDHGGGVPYGYGQDDLNPREAKDGDPGTGTMLASEVAAAIAKAGLKFDIIGYDACLMQDIEIASSLEPYADYYLASEETEGGTGWFYTSAFGKLAQDPGMSSEEFGREMIACYDPYNRITMGDGKPVPASTLSFVDLTLAKPACRKLGDMLASVETAVREDPDAFADVAGAAASAYSFSDNMQIDLIDFLKILDKMDYGEQICSHQEKKDLRRALQASVLYRNGDAAKGVNGLSVAFPYKAIGMYGDTSRQLKALSMNKEKDALDVIFSIMAAQQQKDKEKKEKEFQEDPSLQGFSEMWSYGDYTNEDWYIKGFEDYSEARAFVDIPLIETPEGYRIDLPQKAWKLVADCRTVLYQKVEGDAGGAASRYLGADYIGGDDADGHPMVSMDGSWVHIEGQPVCYEADPVKETDEGDVYTGKVKARLNGRRTITLIIEWDPVKEDQTGDQETPTQGRVIGYESDSILDTLLNMKGERQFRPGDTIQFLYDYYDKEGNLVETRADGKKIRVSKQERITVTDQPLEDGNISFGGVLTDVYQRVMTTEMIDVSADGE